MPEPLGIRRVLASDGRRVRGIRLEALGDPAAGIAFHETRDAAHARPARFWDERAVGAALSGAAAQFVAEQGREWVATVTVLMPDEHPRGGEDGSCDPVRALLVAVYVRPSQRGSGLLEELVTAAGDWARERGAGELVLEVHDENSRAQRAYRRIGFTETGVRSDGPNGLEREMVQAL
jgi:GNAT superfamily N-acetyltransferase